MSLSSDASQTCSDGHGAATDSSVSCFAGCVPEPALPYTCVHTPLCRPRKAARRRARPAKQPKQQQQQQQQQEAAAAAALTQQQQQQQQQQQTAAPQTQAATATLTTTQTTTLTVMVTTVSLWKKTLTRGTSRAVWHARAV